ncbi:serine/threonine-protein kinase [Tuwongella immobilis]|uniref:Protein kinase domain-containing protein n=1 Tax=Tuwongella immobilis TaxID=692036 RepID=A0A6C2YKV3_9BACT|nr:serine/threonine-protein kinase [Tuwongella immobilis]VIP01735.1 serine threonine protein partial : Serine/threonine protein kinase OS=Planctomyces maris DSM 8797 GN=PM8797T_04085 PE=3 SV=1: Pkinase: LRR_4 [Tuwongella immobilis]VTR99293.1 serine threonine protein partial : Serine/threonine protein kinase OS=Planctomyces maris DSM 8797 GN=PM8797T_04085 PE=3 SV=1: Pkinase: LRR_4 [Tuwongella immobilis]
MSTPQPVRHVGSPELPAADPLPDPVTPTSPMSGGGVPFQPAPYPSLNSNPHSDSDPSTQYPLPQGVVPLHQEHPYLRPPTRMNSLGRLGHYEILAVLGSGGFGKVFQALDEKLQRLVALKVLHNRYDDGSHAVERFMREARAAAAIHHENVVIIHAIEEYPVPFLVMEYIQGQTLNQRMVQRGPMPVGELLHLGVQIARGMAAAHELGIIHRDIKPANILLNYATKPHAKLTDFGLARQLDDARLTGSGIVVGTPMYIAPEQAQGDDCDARGDQFSFGAVLYHMAAGIPPFSGSNTLALLLNVTTGSKRPLAEVRPELPARIVAVIERLLANTPEQRFPTSQALVAELEQILDDWTAGRLDEHSPVPPTAISPMPISAGIPLGNPQRNPFPENVLRANPDGAPRRGGFRWVGWTVAASVLAGLAGIGSQLLFRGEPEDASALGNPNESIASLPNIVPPFLNDPIRPGVEQEPPMAPQLPPVEEVVPKPPLLVHENPPPVGTPEYAKFCQVQREHYQKMRQQIERLPIEQQIQTFVREMLAANPDLPQPIDLKREDVGLVVAIPWERVVNFGPLVLVPQFHQLTLTGYGGPDRCLDFEAIRDLRLTIFETWASHVHSLDVLHTLQANHIDLASLPMDDLSWIRNCSTVRSLTLQLKPAASVTPLYDHPLQKLAFRGPPPDLRLIRGLKLNRFDLWEFRLSDDELDSLRSLEVEDLSIGGNRRIQTLNWVPKEPKLKQLAVNGTSVSDLSPLKGSSIEMLWIIDTNVRDLTPLQFMPNLRELHCKQTKIADFSPLQGTYLELVDADFVFERDAPILQKMPRLKLINYQDANDYLVPKSR